MHLQNVNCNFYYKLFIDDKINQFWNIKLNKFKISKYYDLLLICKSD